MTQSDYDLAALMAHPRFPFPDWETDGPSFLLLELFWAEFLRDVLGDAAGGWGPRYDTPRDGNPILAVGNPATRRAVRIVAITNEEARPVYPDAVGGDTAYYRFSAFTGLADEFDGAPPWEELGFCVELHPDVLEIARTLLRMHCVENRPLSETEKAIHDYERQVGMDQVSE